MNTLLIIQQAGTHFGIIGWIIIGVVISFILNMILKKDKSDEK